MSCKRLSRLSTDDARVQRRASWTSSCEKNRPDACPSCGQLGLTTVSVDGELTVFICDGCQHSLGVDDSMDVETVAPLLVDEELGRDVRMTVITCRQCLNDDLERFVVVALDPDRQVLSVMCEGCSSVSDVPLNDWAAGDGPRNDDHWMAEVLGSVEDDGGSLCSGGDSGYAVDDRHVDHGIDVVPFSCRCGNNEVDCFTKRFDRASGDLATVKCLACDDEKVLDTFFGVECGHCGNDRKELFERSADDFGRITSLCCLACDKRLYCPGQRPATKRRKSDNAQLEKMSPVDRKSGYDRKRDVGKTASGAGTGWTRITDLADVRRGDHVAWHKWYAVWHHAIVVMDVPDDGRSLTVIHNNGDIVKLDGHFASIRLETLDVNPTKEDFYRIDYPTEDIQPVDKVVERACRRLGQAKYNPFTNNCEHFARWCKTGRAHSGQVCKFTDRLALVGRGAVAKATLERAADGVESLVAGSVNTVSRLGTSIPQRVGKVFGTTSGVVRNAKCGALACNVAINLALEAGLFTKDVVRAYRKYKSGAISGDEFRRLLSKHGCESVGGLIGGSSMGVVGQVLVPIPFLGGTVGCTLGSLIGRYIGALIGKQLAAIKH